MLLAYLKSLHEAYNGVKHHTGIFWCNSQRFTEPLPQQLQKRLWESRSKSCSMMHIFHGGWQSCSCTPRGYARAFFSPDFNYVAYNVRGAIWECLSKIITGPMKFSSLCHFKITVMSWNASKNLIRFGMTFFPCTATWTTQQLNEMVPDDCSYKFHVKTWLVFFLIWHKKEKNLKY